VEIALLILLIAVLSRYGALGDRWRGVVAAAVRPALILGGIGFAAGFFGPMLLKPEANQGPMLGIFITGPIGFLVGLLYGIVRQWQRADPGPHI
jgi:preprotein translocase subunit Sss1